MTVATSNDHQLTLVMDMPRLAWPAAQWSLSPAHAKTHTPVIVPAPAADSEPAAGANSSKRVLRRNTLEFTARTLAVVALTHLFNQELNHGTNPSSIFDSATSRKLATDIAAWATTTSVSTTSSSSTTMCGWPVFIDGAWKLTDQPLDKHVKRVRHLAGGKAADLIKALDRAVQGIRDNKEVRLGTLEAPTWPPSQPHQDAPEADSDVIALDASPTETPAATGDTNVPEQPQGEKDQEPQVAVTPRMELAKGSATAIKDQQCGHAGQVPGVQVESAAAGTQTNETKEEVSEAKESRRRAMAQREAAEDRWLVTMLASASEAASEDT